MRVVFLDFDGVIATCGTYKRARTIVVPGADGRSEIQWPNPVELIAPRLVANVSKLCTEVGASIILTTSWRTEFSLATLEEFLRASGLDPAVAVIDTTPIPGLGHRGREIAASMEKHDLRKESMLILEDREDVSPFRGRQVTTSFLGSHAGFTARHLQFAIRQFRRRT